MALKKCANHWCSDTKNRPEAPGAPGKPWKTVPHLFKHLDVEVDFLKSDFLEDDFRVRFWLRSSVWIPLVFFFWHSIFCDYHRDQSCFRFVFLASMLAFVRISSSKVVEFLAFPLFGMLESWRGTPQTWDQKILSTLNKNHALSFISLFRVIKRVNMMTHTSNMAKILVYPKS